MEKTATQEEVLKKVPFVPHGSYVLLEEDTDKERTSKGGIVMPATRRTTSEQRIRRVLAVGPGSWKLDQFVPCLVKVGQLVMTTSRAGLEVEIDGTAYRLVLDEEILGSLTEDLRK